MKNLKELLKDTEMLEFSNGDNVAFIWFNKKTQRFILEFNAKIIKATKTINPIQTFLEIKKLDLV